MTNQLTNWTDQDEIELKYHEQVIEKGLETFVEVGLSLAAIRDSKLYRKNFNTFEDYCQETMGRSRQWANNLIKAAEVATQIENGNNCFQKPATESQARPLGKLDTAEQRNEAWSNAVANSPTGTPTAKEVNAEVEKLRARLAESEKDVSILKQQALVTEQEKATAIANLNQQLSVAQHNIQKLQTEDKKRFEATVQDRLEMEVSAVSKEFDQELNRLTAEKLNLERKLTELQTNPTPEMQSAIATLEQAKRLTSQEVEHLEKKQAELQKQIAADAVVADQNDRNNRTVAKFYQAIAGLHANHPEVFGVLVGTLTPTAKQQLIEAQGLLNQLSGIIDSVIGDRPQKVVQIKSKTIEVEAV